MIEHLMQQPVRVYRHSVASTTDMGEKVTTKSFVATENCNIQVAGEFVSFRDMGFAITGDYIVFASASSVIKEGDVLSASLHGSVDLDVNSINPHYRYNELHHLRIMADLVRRPKDA